MPALAWYDSSSDGCLRAAEGLTADLPAERLRILRENRRRIPELQNYQTRDAAYWPTLAPGYFHWDVEGIIGELSKENEK